jgi:hypothetical protein
MSLLTAEPATGAANVFIRLKSGAWLEVVVIGRAHSHTRCCGGYRSGNHPIVLA